ncbi:hemerythrin domain-containing protein [Selenomonas bovis]
MYLELLVDHHTSIHSLLKHLSAFTSASILAANAEEASRAVSRLAELLTVHLAAEDKFLYPSLARSEDEHIRTTAARFDEEMGHLASTFLS